MPHGSGIIGTAVSYRKDRLRHSMTNYMICYDIADRRRLSRVHRSALKHAMPMQYSVFLLRGSKEALDAMLVDIEKLINPAEDDVRAYTIAPSVDVDCIGVNIWPEEVYVHETSKK